MYCIMPIKRKPNQVIVKVLIPISRNKKSNTQLIIRNKLHYSRQHLVLHKKRRKIIVYKPTKIIQEQDSLLMKIRYRERKRRKRDSDI